jgi:CRISPR system Cascade subunit CasC
MLIEIHILQNHAPSNLNRDDTGSPKECVFGGIRRGRISSQCLKRSIRRSDFFQENQKLQDHLAIRTRRLPELVRERFMGAKLDAEFAEIAARKASGFGTTAGKEQDPKDGKYRTAQTMFLTQHDIDAVAATLLEAARGAKKAKAFADMKAAELQEQARQEGYRPLTVDVALFGRMITSEAFRDVEACTQVAHAISTHEVKHEFDYFTAVDDLVRTDEEREEDVGSDMLGDVEFNSACYYKYLSIDVDGFLENLTGARLRDVSKEDQKAANQLAQETLDSLLRAAIQVTPTGKQNSFAAHQLPAAVLVEVRPRRTPVSYANAFVEPARPGRDGDLVRSSLAKLSRHVEALAKGFNLEADPRLLLAPDHPDPLDPEANKPRPWIDGAARVDDLATLCARVREVVKNG